MPETLPESPLTLRSRAINGASAQHEERPGFSYEILLKPEEGYGISMIVGHVKPGGESPPKRMTKAQRTYTLSYGDGDWHLNGELKRLKKGDGIVIGVGDEYDFVAGSSGMELSEVNVLTSDYKPGDKLYELVEEPAQ